jgi:hypothetical protein
MNPVFARKGALSALLVSAALMAGCQSSAPPPAPAPQPAAPPAPAAAPPMALSSSVVQAAAAYQAYVRQATALTPTFADGESIQSSLRQGEAYEPKALARDTVAYAAVLALQEPTFVQGVRAFAADPKQRAEIVQKIEQDPNYAASFPGAAAAANLIAARLGSDGNAIAHAGYAIKQSAYTIQHQKWSSEFVKDREGRLAMAKQLSSTAGTAPNEDSAALMKAAMTGQGLGDAPPPAPGAAAPAPGAAAPASLQPPYTAGINRGLAVAALAALGAAGDADQAQIEPLLDENVGQPCLNLAKLNLFQCLAVSKPHYEDVFCLGQHALMDTGECVAREAGVIPANFEPAPEPKPAVETKGKKSRHHGKATSHHKRHHA